MKASNTLTAIFVTSFAAILLAGCAEQDGSGGSGEEMAGSGGQPQTDMAQQSDEAMAADDGDESVQADEAMGGDLRKAIEEAVAHADRPEADQERDALRKPVDVLAFFGIAPGMRVFEYSAGSGYYTEILSRLLGPEGKLIAHNNPAFAQYYSEGMTERLGGGAFENVTHLEVDPDNIDLEPNSLDAALITLAYHDLFFSPEDGGALPDRAHLLAELHKALKPGAVLGVIDHKAPEGADPHETGAGTHRIDPAFVRREVEAAGFVLAEASDLLAHPQDDITVPFWEQERGTTDRFVFRFKVVK